MYTCFFCHLTPLSPPALVLAKYAYLEYLDNVTENSDSLSGFLDEHKKKPIQVSRHTIQFLKERKYDKIQKMKNN